MKFSAYWKIAIVAFGAISVTPALAVPAVNGASYTVRSGDTFARIARSKGISLGALLQANRISNPDRIQLGQRIVIPAAGAAKATQKTDNKVQSRESSKARLVTSNTKNRKDSTTVDITPPSVAGSYAVQKGDTLSRIAKHTGVSSGKLMSLNGLSENSILRIGQVLKTGGVVTAQKTPPIEQPATSYDDGDIKRRVESPPAGILTSGGSMPTTSITHQVKSGETFTSITRDFGITSAQLAAANRGVDPHRLRAGQSLLIPGQPARTLAKPLTVRADGRVIAEHPDPLDPGYAAASMPVAERTRTGYQVEADDTLEDIARRYNTTTDYLRGLNRMGPTEGVYPGRYILVPFTPRNPSAPGSRPQQA